QWTLTDLFGTERSVLVRVFDHVGDAIRHFERTRALVFEHRRDLVQEDTLALMRTIAVGHLFHHRLAEPHVDRTFDLTHRNRGVEGATNVVRHPHLRNAIDASLWVDFDFHHGRRVAVAGTRSNPTTAELRSGLGWRIAADRANRANLRFRDTNRLHERHAGLRFGRIKDATLREHQP